MTQPSQFVSPLLVVVASWGLTTVAQAGMVLDQSFDPTGIANAAGEIENVSSSNYAEQAQSFTTGIAGKISRVDLYLSRITQNFGNLILEIRRTVSNGFPSVDPADIVASTILSGADVPYPLTNHAFVEFNLGDTAPIVAVGDSYAVVLRAAPDGGRYDWEGSNADPYALGKLSTRAPFYNDVWSDPNSSPRSDLGFKTFVTVPEPSSLALTGIAWLLCLGCAGRPPRTHVIGRPQTFVRKLAISSKWLASSAESCQQASPQAEIRPFSSRPKSSQGNDF